MKFETFDIEAAYDTTIYTLSIVKCMGETIVHLFTDSKLIAS